MTKQITAIVLAVCTSISMMGCYGDATGVEAYDSTAAALTADGGCADFSAPLLSYNALGTGAVVVSNTATEIKVQVNADTLNNFMFTDLHVYVGLNPMPRIGTTHVDLFAFPYKASYINGTQETVTFPLVDLVAGDACGAALYVAVRANMKKTDMSGNVIAEYPSYAYTEEFIGQTCPCAGNEFIYTVCCTPPTTEQGCTLTQGYWKTHNEFSKNRSQKINWPAPMDESAKICSTEPRTNLQLLQLSNAGGNAYLILAKQYLAAKLNVAKGTSTTVQVDNALSEAAALINANCGQYVPASSATGTAMTLLGGILDSYNNGLIGPGRCAE